MKRRKKAVLALGAAGLSLASGASGTPTTDVPQLSPSASTDTYLVAIIVAQLCR
jgi:hypothetical protein